MTQRESVGGTQDRMAEMRDFGTNLGCDGAEGGSKMVSILHICLDTVCITKQVCGYTFEGVKMFALFVFFSCRNTTI